MGKITTADLVEHPDKSGAMVTRSVAAEWIKKNCTPEEVKEIERENKPTSKPLDQVQTGDLEDNPENPAETIPKKSKKAKKEPKAEK